MLNDLPKDMGISNGIVRVSALVLVLQGKWKNQEACAGPSCCLGFFLN